MPDVELRFQGSAVGAVDATKSVDEALGDLSTAAVQAQASLRQALDGVNGDPAEAEIRKVKNELEATSTQAVQTKLLLASLFSGFDTSTIIGGLGAIAAGFGGVFSSAVLVKSAFADMKMPAFWAGLDLGIQLVGALGAALVALLGAIAPVTGAILALPGIFASLATTVLAVKLGFDGVGDALKAGTAAAEESAVASAALAAAEDRVAAATENLRSAKDALAAAQQRARQAQEDLTLARKAAAEAIEDLRLRVEAESLQEEAAKLALARAQENLTRVTQDGTSSALEIAEAQLRVKEAEFNLKVIQEQRHETETNLRTAEKLGIEGSPQVVAAKQAIRDAENDVKTAQDNVKLATEAVSAATDAMKVVMNQTTPEVQKFQDAMAKLSPAAQEFVTQLLLLRPRLDELKAIASENLFQGINDGLRLASTDANWDALKAVVGSTATVLGNLARDLGAMFADPQWARDLQTIGEINARVLDSLGQAFLNLLPALRDVIIAAAPFTQWLVDGVREFTEWIARAAEAGRETGTLAAFLDRTKEAMRLLWDVARPLGSVFLDIGAAAAPLGREILRDLANELDRLSAWTSSEGGQETMRQYFENAKPAIYEAARLLRDVSGALLSLSANEPGGGALVDFLNRLRTEVLPLFKDVTAASGEAFGQVLADAIINILRLFADLSGPNGPLVALVSVISNVAGAFASLLENNPLLQDMVFTLVGMLTWMKLIAATGIVSFLVTMVAALLGVGPAATAGATGFTALNVAMRANPIGLIITALQLLVAAVILAYTRSETFRDIVHQTWDAIKQGVAIIADAVSWLWKLVEPLVDLYLRFNPVIAAVRLLIDNFQAVIDWVRANWQIIVTLIAGPFAPLVALATDAFGVRSALIGAFNAIATFLTNFITRVRGIATSIGQAIENGIKAGLTGIVTAVETFLNAIRTELTQRIAVFTTAARNLGLAIYNGIRNAVTGIANVVGTIIGNVVRAVTGFVTRAAQAGAALGRAIAAGIRNAFANIATQIATLVRGALNSALRIVNAGIGAINSALQFSINVPDIIPGLPNVIQFNPPNIPYIPYLASGGVVTEPTLAMIGERGPEAVIPLDQAGLGGGMTVQITVQGSVVTERDLVKAVTDGIERSRRRGSSVLTPSLAGVRR